MGAGVWQAAIMTAAMLAGMAVHELSSRPAQDGVVVE
jgi:hypothetical protein